MKSGQIRKDKSLMKIDNPYTLINKTKIDLRNLNFAKITDIGVSRKKDPREIKYFYNKAKKKIVMLPSATDRKNVKTRVAVGCFFLGFLGFLMP